MIIISIERGNHSNVWKIMWRVTLMMIYNLKNIFEGFQSRMKSKLKDLTDEDKSRKKMLLNTFDSVDIDEINNTVVPYEICRILGRNIDGKVFYFEEGAAEELRNLNKSKSK